MPKLKPSETQTMDNAFRGTICNKMKRMELDVAGIGKLAGVGQTAMYARMKNPKLMTLENLRRMARNLKLTDAEILELIRTPPQS